VFEGEIASSYSESLGTGENERGGGEPVLLGKAQLSTNEWYDTVQKLLQLVVAQDPELCGNG